jgi:membrane fusion protein, multidrug efflux system
MTRKKIMPFILGAVLLIAAFFGGKKILHLINNEETENSQLETNIVPVLSKIGGYVMHIYVKDNQFVKVGDTLARIDDRDLKIRVLQAEAALKNAEANVALIASNAGTANANVSTNDASFQAQNAGIATASAQVATSNANVEAAKIRVWKTTQDFNRYQTLLNQKSVTQQQFDGIKAEKEGAEAALLIAQNQVLASQAAVQVAEKQANVGNRQKMAAQTQVGSAARQVDLARTIVAQRSAELDLAKLQLSFAVVTAPIAGQVSKKSIQLSQLVNPGQPLMSIVDNEGIWVVANFKETQVAKMEVGQKVTVKVDAYEGKEFEGTIESFAGATGAKFSLLPPDNASGNFVKVVQRIATKILISKNNDNIAQLRAGMSVVVVVPVK